MWDIFLPQYSMVTPRGLALRNWYTMLKSFPTFWGCRGSQNTPKSNWSWMGWIFAKCIKVVFSIFLEGQLLIVCDSFIHVVYFENQTPGAYPKCFLFKQGLGICMPFLFQYYVKFKHLIVVMYDSVCAQHTHI